MDKEIFIKNFHNKKEIWINNNKIYINHIIKINHNFKILEWNNQLQYDHHNSCHQIQKKDS